jgi:enoyl-CoA hydratase
MDKSYNHLIIELTDEQIAILTINRPDKLNALNSHVLDELHTAFSDLKSDKKVKAVIVTGAGEKAFVAGADISELRELNSERGKSTSQKGQNIFFEIEKFPKPVLALVNGYALGGGAELAMSCHLRIAVEHAVFGLPEVSLGLIPGYGGTQRLPALIGKSKAMELILTGGQLNADEAASLGLVNEVVKSNDAIEYAKNLLTKILKNGPVAIQNAIKAVNEAGTETGFEKEAELFGELCDTDDFLEGTSAFIEKRKPDFKGT